MLACHNMRVRYIDTILKVEVIQLQHKSNRLRSMHPVEVRDIFCGIECKSPGCLERLLGESSVTLHTCKVEGRVHPIQVKCCDNCLPSHPKNRMYIIYEYMGTLFLYSTTAGTGPLPVSDVAGVVDPHEFIKTLTPPSGQVQPHVEAVFSILMWVPPAEPITLKLGLFLTINHKVYKLSLKRLVKACVSATFHKGDTRRGLEQILSHTNSTDTFSPRLFSCRQQQRLWFDCLCPVRGGNDRAGQNPFCNMKTFSNH